MNNYKDKSDIDLIYMAKYDDKLALNELVKRYQDKVYNGFATLGLDNDLSDLTQEALLKVSKSLKNLNNPEKFNNEEGIYDGTISIASFNHPDVYQFRMTGETEWHDASYVYTGLYHNKY